MKPVVPGEVIAGMSGWRRSMLAVRPSASRVREIEARGEPGGGPQQGGEAAAVENGADAEDQGTAKAELGMIKAIWPQSFNSRLALSRKIRSRRVKRARRDTSNPLSRNW